MVKTKVLISCADCWFSDAVAQTIFKTDLKTTVNKQSMNVGILRQYTPRVCVYIPGECYLANMSSCIFLALLEVVHTPRVPGHVTQYTLGVCTYVPVHGG